MIELCLFFFCFVKPCTHFLRGQTSFHSHRCHCRPMRLPLSTAEPAPPPVICSARFLWSRLCSPLSNACTFPLPASLCPDSGTFSTLNHNGCPHLLSKLPIVVSGPVLRFSTLYLRLSSFFPGSPCAHVCVAGTSPLFTDRLGRSSCFSLPFPSLLSTTPLCVMSL